MGFLKIGRIVSLLGIMIPMSVHALSYTTDEWLSKSAAERQYLRSQLPVTEALSLWNSLSLDQKMALDETNRSLSIIQQNQDVPYKPVGSPFTINEWMIKGPAERALLRAQMPSTTLNNMWNALNLSQKNALGVINSAYERVLAAQSSADLCSGFSNVQYMDVSISYTRAVMNFRFDNDTIVVARFTVPADYSGTNNYIDASVAEWRGPPTLRTASLSTRPCDFRKVDLNGQIGPLAVSGGTLPVIYADIGPGKPSPQVLPGQTYYLNIRNVYIDSDGQYVKTCQENTDCNASITIMDRRY